jgi:hypothetical protein
MSNITNLNRDYLIKINVKEATIDVPKMTFWNTDKKTSNMFVQLVINMSTNELISQYVTVQNATDYKITLNVIKPKTKQYKTIEATLLNEEKALFEIDLPDEFTDQVGDYSFEFEVSSKVDSNDESITTSNGTYKVNGSILTNLNEETSSSPDLPILKQLIEQVKSLQGGDLTGYQKKNDAAQKTIVEDGKLYLTKLDGTKLDDGTTLPTGSGTSIDDTNTTTDKTWSSSKIDSQFKDIANNQPTDLSLDSATNLLQLVNSKGSKLGNGITLPISSGGGTSQYLHIKYSTTGAPQLAGQISDTPNAYIGLCVDANADAPINPHSYTWYKWKGEAGAKGDTGATPSLQIGTVETLESGSSATASITGTTENPLLNLGIPRGEGGTGGSEKEWKLLKDLTLTETVSAITEIFDNDYKEILIIAKGKAGGTSNCGMAITSYSENQASGVDLVLSSILWQVNEECTFSIYLCAENPVLFLIWKRCNSSILSSSEGTYNSANWNDKKGINKLLFRYGTFAEGNNYKIYGR